MPQAGPTIARHVSMTLASSGRDIPALIRAICQAWRDIREGQSAKNCLVADVVTSWLARTDCLSKTGTCGQHTTDYASQLASQGDYGLMFSSTLHKL